MENKKKIVAINLGSTSTKIVYYEDEQCILKENLSHPAEELQQFDTIWDQYEYRKKSIEAFLKKNNIDIKTIDAVATRGGNTEPVEGGIWSVNAEMLRQSESEAYGTHACNLGLKIAYGYAQEGLKAFTVDSPSTDEFEPIARYSGLPQLPRRCSFHVLNQRAVAKQYAKDIGRDYEELNIVGVHMGGGISIAAHKKGKLVDANNALDGDGTFSTNRCGTVPVGSLVDLCFSGEYTHGQVRKLINGEGGMMAYLQENDVQTIEGRALNGDAYAKEVLDAMCYQTAKDIGAFATVLKGDVDAILITGGIANSKYIVNYIKESVGFIATIGVYPGEMEMQSLALHALMALRGKEKVKEMR